MTYQAMGGWGDEGPDGYLQMRMAGQWGQLYMVAGRTVQILLTGAAGSLALPQSGGRTVPVSVPAEPTIAVIFRNYAKEANSIAGAVVNALVRRERLRRKSGTSVKIFNLIAKDVTEQVRRALKNAGDPAGCRRSYGRLASAFTVPVMPSPSASTGWCYLSPILLLDVWGKVVTGCLGAPACRLDRNGNVESAQPPATTRVVERSPAGAPRTPTPAQIAGQAEHERLVAQNVAARSAVTALMGELGIDAESESASSDLQVALDDNGITLDEARDWLVACDYDLMCFQTEMYIQLAKAKRRQEASAGGRWVTIAAASALGIAVVASMRGSA